jgi:hypothetical protein
MKAVSELEKKADKKTQRISNPKYNASVLVISHHPADKNIRPFVAIISLVDGGVKITRSFPYLCYNPDV